MQLKQVLTPGYILWLLSITLATISSLQYSQVFGSPRPLAMTIIFLIMALLPLAIEPTGGGTQRTRYYRRQQNQGQGRSQARNPQNRQGRETRQQGFRTEYVKLNDNDEQ